MFDFHRTDAPRFVAESRGSDVCMKLTHMRRMFRLLPRIARQLPRASLRPTMVSHRRLPLTARRISDTLAGRCGSSV